MNVRKSKRCLRKEVLVLMAALSVVTFNIFNAVFYRLPTDASSTIINTREQGMPGIQKLVLPSDRTLVSSDTRQPFPTVPPKPTSSSTRGNIPSTTPPPLKGNIMYYHLVADARYDYEFRFDFNSGNTTDDPRLMILLNGSRRTCIDYWEFPVGRRILEHLRTFRFLILAICSKRQKFDVDGPAQANSDVKWIYLSLQKWLNEFYYKHFQCYPRLYIHGVSRGSKLAALLSRVLPIQAQIFTIYPGHWSGLLTRSDHPAELQTRLQLDSAFANWFYFDFCYNTKPNGTKLSDLCPLEQKRNNYQPVPPTYFIHLKNDPYFKVTDYSSVVDEMKKKAISLGGSLLNHTQAVTLFILPPLNATLTYMQKSWDLWNDKPYASELFYEHYTNPIKYKPIIKAHRTCLCLQINFRHYELYPNITKTWSKQKQAEYKDYAQDVKQFETFFCEDICGDLYTHHAISSRELDKALQWTELMDQSRQTFYIQDYLARPLRIWMYDKNSLITKATYYSSKEPIWDKMAKRYQMYAPEYYLQDYLQRLKASSTFSHHDLQWTNNPLLADYFIIPHDLMFYYCYPEPSNLTVTQFREFRDKLNKEYFAPLLKKIRTIFPYWTMAKEADQMGSNHVIAMLNGRNMGFLHNDTQIILKNVIQLVFTGIRQDLLPPGTPMPYGYRGTVIVYRHNYDIVLPQFTRLKSNLSTSRNLNTLYQKKKRLFFFAGALEHIMTRESARAQLSSLWKDIHENHTYNNTTEIQGKQYETIIVVKGHTTPNEYINLIQSSIFSLCPEGFLPWSPRLYDAIQIGTIPAILSDNIVLPFERFINWQSISAKINISNIRNISNFAHRINYLEQYVKQKLSSALPYIHTFQWPYSDIGEHGQNKHVFLLDEDGNGTIKNVFYYISMELRCRRLEQLFGFTSDSLSTKSLAAQRKVCQTYPTICPCHDAKPPVAFQEYV